MRTMKQEINDMAVRFQDSGMTEESARDEAERIASVIYSAGRVSVQGVYAAWADRIQKESSGIGRFIAVEIRSRLQLDANDRIDLSELI